MESNCQLAGAFVKRSKLFQRQRHLHLEVLALREEPLVELQAIGKRKFVQKIAAHHIERLCQPGGTFRAILLVGVRMAAAGLDQGAKAGHIQFVITERIEAQGEPISGQIRLLVGSARSQRFLKLCPGHAEVVLSSSSRQVGPQQAKQKFTAVRVIRLDQQIGQQSDRLTVGEGNRSQLAMPDLQLTE